LTRIWQSNRSIFDGFGLIDLDNWVSRDYHEPRRHSRPMQNQIDKTLRTEDGGRPVGRLGAPGFKRVQLLMLCGFVLVFSAFTLFVVLHMRTGDWNDHRNHPILGVWLTISGPFIGAVIRPYDPYSVQMAWKIFPVCAAILGLGTIVQCIPLPFKRGAQGLRLGLWAISLLGWFAGGVLSIFCALGE